MLLILIACHRGSAPAADSPIATDTADSGASTTDTSDTTPTAPRCNELPRPTSTDAIALVPAFPSLSFELPVAMVQAPGDNNHWYLVEKAGRVWRFEDDPGVAVATPALDITDRVESAPNEAGLLGIAFAPDFETTGEVYLSYTAPVGILLSRISRFSASAGIIDPDSEAVVLEVPQPTTSHNGGGIAFGPDGYLYAGFGDGGGVGDPYENAQNPDSLLGKMLRVDVAAAEPYAIPPDNPFADGGGAGEVFALGFRNPWRWSFDGAGNLWVGDVGQFVAEEIDVVELGTNHGWPIMEGDTCYDAQTCDATGLTLPVATYDRTGIEAAIIGGFVYAGSEVSELGAAYVFGDGLLGKVWSVPADPTAAPLTPMEIAADTGLFASSFAQGMDGEVFVLDYGSGGVFQLAAPYSGKPVTFPQHLSETGCMDSSDPSQPAEGLIPYRVNVELWSDGATKERWISLPPGSLVDIDAAGDWHFPVGTVLVKQFRLEHTLLETRLLVHHPDGWAGYTYTWNADGTDATLLDGTATRAVGDQDWVFPSRSQCLSCHTDVAGRSLGLTTPQLNRDGQLEDFTAFLTSPPEGHDALPTLDGDAPADQRARAYLDTNCAFCHQPGGTGGGAMDLRWGTPLADMALCNEPPSYGTLGPADSLLLYPGRPERSILALRMRDPGPYRMPPVGSNVVDELAVEVIESWIDGLADCAGDTF